MSLDLELQQAEIEMFSARNKGFNNIVLRRIANLLGISTDDDLLKEIFKLGGYQENISNAKIKGWRTKPDKKQHKKLSNEDFIMFLDGLFIFREQMIEQGKSPYWIDVKEIIKERNERKELRRQAKLEAEQQSQKED